MNISKNTITAKSGLLSNIKNKLGKFGKSIDEFIEKYVEIDAQVISQRENPKTGGVDITLKLKGKEVQISLLPTDTDKVVNLVIHTKNGKDIEIDGLTESQVEPTLQQNFNKLFKDEIESCKLTLSNRVIKGSNNISMHKIMCSSDYNTTAECVDTLLADNSFIDNLSSVPKSFDIVSNGDNMSVFEISDDYDVDIPSIIARIFDCAVTTYSNLKAIHWGCDGSNFFTIHEKLDTYTTEMLAEIDFYGELAVEKCNITFNPGNITIENLYTPQSNLDTHEYYRLIQENLNNYINTMNLYYCDFDHDVQSSLDNFIRYWNTEANFKLKQSLK